jgi:hypothetical protein
MKKGGCIVYHLQSLELIVVPDEQMKHPFQELCILIISPEEILTNTLPASVFNGASGLACYRFSIKENATIIGSVLRDRILCVVHYYSSPGRIT